MSGIEITQGDREAWEKFGPAIFHCDMSGPEALARHRIEARAAALEEARWAAHGACVELAFAKGPENPASDYSAAMLEAIRALREQSSSEGND